jgi:predicted enzyme related to lactoylglutathione lyase
VHQSLARQPASLSLSVIGHAVDFGDLSAASSCEFSSTEAHQIEDYGGKVVEGRTSFRKVGFTIAATATDD